MNLRIPCFSLLLGCIFLIPHAAQGYDEISVEYSVKKRSFTARIACEESEASLIKTKRGSDKLLALSKVLKKAKQKAKKKPSAKTRKAVKKLKALSKAASTACEEQQNTTPTPTPTPGNNEEGLFTSEGDVTNTGKSLLEIPEELSANINTGQTVYANFCSGCHGERSADTFTALRAEIIVAPMYYTDDQLTDQQLADLLAYLSRFRTEGV